MSPVYTTEDVDFPNAVEGDVSSADIWREGNTSIIQTPESVSGTPRTEWLGFAFQIDHTLSAGDGFGNLGHSTVSPIGVTTGTVFTVYQRSQLGSPKGNMRLYVVPEAAPSAWSTALLPGTRNERLIADPVALIAGIHPDTGTSWGDQDPLNITLNATGLTEVNAVLKSSRYRGLLFLSMHLEFTNGTFWSWSASESNTRRAPQLSTVEFADHTGFGDNWRSDLPGRAQHDDRFGFPVHTREWERDGYTGSLRVLPGDADPEDPVDEYIPRPTEGAVDDEPA